MLKVTLRISSQGWEILPMPKLTRKYFIALFIPSCKWNVNTHLLPGQWDPFRLNPTTPFFLFFFLSLSYSHQNDCLPSTYFTASPQFPYGTNEWSSSPTHPLIKNSRITASFLNFRCTFTAFSYQGLVLTFFYFFDATTYSFTWGPPFYCGVCSPSISGSGL